MNRRSFLGSILSAGVAPFVMSNGIGGGVLMPVRTLLDPADWIDGLNAAQLAIPKLEILDAAGNVLVTMDYPEGANWGANSVSGTVVRDGTIDAFRLTAGDLPSGLASVLVRNIDANVRELAVGMNTTMFPIRFGTG